MYNTVICVKSHLISLLDAFTATTTLKILAAGILKAMHIEVFVFFNVTIFMTQSASVLRLFVKQHSVDFDR